MQFVLMTVITTFIVSAGYDLAARQIKRLRHKRRMAKMDSRERYYYRKSNKIEV